MWRRQWSSARRVRFGLLRSVTAWTLDKPPFIIVLLHNLGTHIDPRVLVEMIEPGLEIHGPRWLDTDIERLQPAGGLQEDPGV